MKFMKYSFIVIIFIITVSFAADEDINFLNFKIGDTATELQIERTGRCVVENSDSVNIVSHQKPIISYDTANGDWIIKFKPKGTR